MVKTQWILLLTTCIVSGCSLLIIIISFLTSQWIVSEASNAAAIQNSQISYGLFSGSLTRHLLATETNFDLALACSFEHGACMFSCQQTGDLRDEELQRIIAGEPLRDCPPRNLGRIAALTAMQERYATIDGRQDAPPNALDSTIPSGLWVTTVLFLSVGAAFAVFAMIMSAINIFTNPVEPIWGVFGLYIWNAATAISVVLTAILWGALYGTRLTQNIAVTDTLQLQGTYNSEGLADLGFSFWILLIAMFAPIANCGLLNWRTRLLEAEPKMPQFVVEAKNDMTDMQF